MNYDIIGDIHGYAEALTALLADMGYRYRGGTWRHPDRQVVFVGDFIDRGLAQVETVAIVRRMVDAQSALAIMGNHEFNAIAWFTPDPQVPGEYLRKRHSGTRGERNFRQHEAFLREVNGTPKHREIIDWFLTLPLWLELDDIRVVHACWHQNFINGLMTSVGDEGRLTRDMMCDACREPADPKDKDSPKFSIFKAVEALAKGIEVELPAGHTFQDKDGHQRRRVRVRWWDPCATTFQSAALLSEQEREALPPYPIPAHAMIGHDGGKPVFIGHYWLQGTPEPLSDKVACVDYSIAKGGKLVAYRWDGNPHLSADNMFWVGK